MIIASTGGIVKEVTAGLLPIFWSTR
jgi:hypothetical protein